MGRIRDRELLRCLCHQVRVSSSQARTEAASKWRQRFLADGSAGLAGRRSQPHRLPAVIARGTTAQRVINLRPHRACGVADDVTYAAVDDHSPLTFAEVWPAERTECTVGFLDHALARHRNLWVRIRPTLTESDKVFDSGLSVRPREQHQTKRLHTRYYRLQTNGKAEPPYPNRAARMGPPAHLSPLAAAHLTLTAPGPRIQRAPTAQQSGRSPADQPPPAHREQRADAPQLGRGFRHREKRPSPATITVSTNVDPACEDGE